MGSPERAVRSARLDRVDSEHAAARDQLGARRLRLLPEADMCRLLTAFPAMLPLDGRLETHLRGVLIDVLAHPGNLVRAQLAYSTAEPWRAMVVGLVRLYETAYLPDFARQGLAPVLAEAGLEVSTVSYPLPGFCAIHVVRRDEPAFGDGGRPSVVGVTVWGSTSDEEGRMRHADMDELLHRRRSFARAGRGVLGGAGPHPRA